MIQTEIKTISEEVVRKTYFDAASIDRILPPDALQNILSFIPHDSGPNKACKAFNRSNKKNYDNERRSRKRAVASNFPADYATYLVDPDRTELTESEITDGVRGPLASITEAMKAIKSGDKILLCAGKHTFSCDGYPEEEFATEFGEYYKDVQIEGLGKCHLSFETMECGGDTLRVYQKLSLCNLKMDQGFIIENEARVWVTDCVMDKTHFQVDDGSSLDCSRCSIHRKNIAFYAQSPCSVDLTDCVFHSTGEQQDVDYRSQTTTVLSLSGEAGVKLNIRGSTFYCLSPERVINDYGALHPDSNLKDTRILVGDGPWMGILSYQW